MARRLGLDLGLELLLKSRLDLVSNISFRDKLSRITTLLRRKFLGFGHVLAEKSKKWDIIFFFSKLDYLHGKNQQ